MFYQFIKWLVLTFFVMLAIGAMIYGLAYAITYFPVASLLVMLFIMAGTIAAGILNG